jgi:hypothetical protein
VIALDVGALHAIVLEHDGKGAAPAWHVKVGVPPSQCS